MHSNLFVTYICQEKQVVTDTTILNQRVMFEYCLGVHLFMLHTNALKIEKYKDVDNNTDNKKFIFKIASLLIWECTWLNKIKRQFNVGKQ